MFNTDLLTAGKVSSWLRTIETTMSTKCYTEFKVSFYRRNKASKLFPDRIKVDSLEDTTGECLICCEEFQPSDIGKIIFGKCCMNSVFHRVCAAKAASSSGIHQTKCPMCQNKEIYIKSIVAQGTKNH